MTRINLLPWREQLREERKRQFFVALACSGVFALLIVVLMHLHFSNKISYQRARNHILEQEVRRLDRQIAEIKELKNIKASLTARMDIIQQLQSSRPQVVHLFDEAIKILPKGVYLTKLERKGDIITLLGRAESNTNVSVLMRNIVQSTWFREPVLMHIKNKNQVGKQVSVFEVRCQIVQPNGLQELLYAR